MTPSANLKIRPVTYPCQQGGSEGRLTVGNGKEALGGPPLAGFAADQGEELLIILYSRSGIPGQGFVADDPGCVHQPEGAVVEPPVRVLFGVQEAVSASDLTARIRREKVGELFAEELQAVAGVILPRVGADGHQLGAGSADLRVVLLQRSSEAGGSIGMEPVAVVADQDQLPHAGS